MPVINQDLLNKVLVEVELRNPTEVNARLMKPGAQKNFIKTVLYGGLFIKYRGKMIPIFYLDDDVSVIIPTTTKDLVVAGGLDNVSNYPVQLVHLAMESLKNVKITVNGASYYELYKVKQFLDMIVPMGSDLREKYMIELYHNFREIQNVMTLERVGDVTVFYLTDGTAVTQVDGRHVKMLNDFTSMFKNQGYSEKEKFFEILRMVLSFSDGKRVVIDERDGLPLISVDGVKWVDLSQESDYIIALYNDSNILANIEDTVILYSKRNSEFDYLKHKARYLYTIKLKNVKKVYKVNSMYLVNVGGELKYRVLKEVIEKIDEIDLFRTQLYSMQEKLYEAKRVATVKVLNLLSSFFEDDDF